MCPCVLQDSGLMHHIISNIYVKVIVQAISYTRRQLCSFSMIICHAFKYDNSRQYLYDHLGEPRFVLAGIISRMRIFNYGNRCNCKLMLAYSNLILLKFILKGYSIGRQCDTCNDQKYISHCSLKTRSQYTVPDWRYGILIVSYMDKPSIIPGQLIPVGGM